MNHFPDSDDDQFDPTVDRLLQQAFAGRPAESTGRASLVDVRARARRHQRRRAGAVVGAAAVVGVGGVGVLSQRDDGATTASPGDDSATSTTADFPVCWYPQPEYPTTTITWPADVSTTDGANTTVLESTEASPTYSTVEWPTATTDPTVTGTSIVSSEVSPTSTTTSLLDAAGVPMTTPCQPRGQYRCIGNTGTDEQGYTYFEYCETSSGGTVTPTTTPMITGGVLVLDASGVPGAADDVFRRLSTSGFGAVQVLSATRTLEQTMLMPIGDGSGLEILRQLTGIDGFDTWSPSLLDGELPAGVSIVVVVGSDWSGRIGLTTTVPATTTTTS